MRRVFPWSMLGIDADADETAVRRAYATKLKGMDPDADHQGFERLREARDRALSLARSRAAAAVENQDDESDDWLAEANGADQWQPGSRDYDEDDSPVASDSADPASASMLYDGIAVTVLRGDVSTGRPMPTLAGVAEPGLSIAAPAIDPERLAGSVHGMDVRAADPDPSMSDPQFSLATQSLDRPDRDDAIVTPSALTHMIDGNLATSQDAIYRLMLDTDRNVALSAEEVALVSSHLDVIFGDARMQEIGFAADMELWLAEVFARSTPRADPLVQRLADQFGWRADAGTVNQPRTIAWLTDCALAFDFRDKVTQPTNKGYKAWIELTTPADTGSKRGRAKHVRELLSTVREKYPVLEKEFDWMRVSLWERSSSGETTGSVNWWTFILPIVFVLVALGRCGAAIDADQAKLDAEAAVEMKLAEFDDPLRRRSAMDDALRSVGGDALTIDIVEGRSPLIVEELDRQLVAAKSRLPTLEMARESLERSLHLRIIGGLQEAPYGLVRDFRQAQAAIMLKLLARDPARCMRFYVGEPVGSGVDMIDLREPLLRAQARLILETNIIVPNRTSRPFSYYEPIADDAANRAGMTRSRLLDIIGSEAPAADQCLARASFLAAAADGPRDLGEVTLREFH